MRRHRRWAWPTAPTRCTRPPSPAGVLKDYRPHDGYFPREYKPYKEAAAREKMQPVLAANPDLARAAEAYQKYMSGRRR